MPSPHIASCASLDEKKTRPERSANVTPEKSAKRREARMNSCRRNEKRGDCTGGVLREYIRARRLRKIVVYYLEKYRDPTSTQNVASVQDCPALHAPRRCGTPCDRCVLHAHRTADDRRANLLRTEICRKGSRTGCEHSSEGTYRAYATFGSAAGSGNGIAVKKDGRVSESVLPGAGGSFRTRQYRTPRSGGSCAPYLLREHTQQACWIFLRSPGSTALGECAGA